MAELPPLPTLGAETQHAHECLQRALLATGGSYALPNPYPDGWRNGLVGIEQQVGEPPVSRLWLVAPVDPQGDPRAALEVFRQVLANLRPEVRGVTTVALTSAELPAPPLLEALERSLGVGVVACTSRASLAGPLATSSRADAAVDALLAVDNALLSAADPAQAWAAITQATQELSEGYQFHRRLQALSPRVYVTPLLMLACVGVWLAQVLSGVDPLDPSVRDLLDWGASAAMVSLDQPWRLITAAFLHGGIIHLGLNMYVLRFLGPLCERMFGSLAFACVYLVAVLGGGLASLAWLPEAPASVGASGGIFGLAGAIGGFMLARRRVVPASVVLRFRRGLGLFVALNVALGFAVNAAPAGIRVDNAAHVGGLVGGFVAGFLLSRPLEPAPARGRLLWVPVLALGLGGAFLAMAHSPRLREESQATRLGLALEPLLTQVDQDWGDLLAGAEASDPTGALERYERNTASTRARLAELTLAPAQEPVRAALDALLAARVELAGALVSQDLARFEAAQVAEADAEQRFKAALEELK